MATDRRHRVAGGPAIVLEDLAYEPVPVEQARDRGAQVQIPRALVRRAVGQTQFAIGFIASAKTTLSADLLQRLGDDAAAAAHAFQTTADAYLAEMRVTCERLMALAQIADGEDLDD